ncbi:MAG: hypothetical protein IKE31_04095 [Eubacterium sp.]|nr:hypothetical protein [Eubacterium sp.]
MEEQQTTTLFRKKALERIASPEQLTQYLRVTNPGIWAVLIAVLLILGGLFAWASVGTLETKTSAKAVVTDHTAQIIPSESFPKTLESGMPLQIASQDYVIASVEVDEYGRSVAYAEVNLPDGSYDAEIVTDETRPIEFLLKSK